MEQQEKPVRWSPEIGRRLKAARGGMSIREAARRAGFSESTWRALELGVRRPAKGIEVPVNPTSGVLIHAAEAVNEDVGEILYLAGLRSAASTTPSDDGLTHADAGSVAPQSRLDLIDARLRRVESLVQQLLDAERAVP